MSDTSLDEFQSVFAEEFGHTPEPDAATPTPDPAPSQPDESSSEPAEPTADEEQVPPAGDETPEGEPANPQGEEPSEPEDSVASAPDDVTEQPKYATADDVKQAMRDYHNESQQRASQVTEARDEIISKLYPGGIDKNIYDSDGKVIKTAQDIVDRGLLKNDGEPYTYEEAASFMLEAGREMTKNIQELNDWADNIAEQNISLMESNQRVLAQWGDVLNQLPKEQVEALAATYVGMLEFDKTNSYITKMPMTPEQFYTSALAPYKSLRDQQAQAQAQAQQEEAQRQATHQQERAGLPPQRGTSETKANTGDPMLDALVDELKKG